MRLIMHQFVMDMYQLKFRIKFFLTISLSLTLTSTFAQSIDDGYDSHTIIKETIAIPGVPSPTAASLGQYANYTVSNFTGTPAIDVPIYEINVGGFKLPISLSYNPSGVKVNDIASWVGLGWSLNCGGVITRNVMDLPDDYYYSTASPYGPPKNGWFGYNYNISYNPSYSSAGLGFPAGYAADAPNADGNFNYIGLELLKRRQQCDTEPDVFYFNFNGNIGKFFFDQGTDTLTYTGVVAPEAHRINLIPYQDLKFSYNIDKSVLAAGIIGSFKVVDNTGNTYYFEKSETTWPDVWGSGFRLTPMESAGGFSSDGSHGSTISSNIESARDLYYYRSSWYLTKLITYENREISFNYTNEYYSIRSPETYSVRGFEPNSANSANLDCSVKYSGNNNASELNRDNGIRALRLTSIETSDLKVVFEANEARQDLAPTSALTGVVVYAKNFAGVLSMIKKTRLDYSYFQSPSDPLIYFSNTTYGDPYKRLKLDRVTETNGANDLKPYVFEYENTYPLPNRFSPHQDFWGYFNNNTCNTLIPTVYIYPSEYGDKRFSVFQKLNYSGTQFAINGADRTVNTTASLAGTLKKINFPLGGSEEFTFGSNVFLHQGQNIKGGGLRLERSLRYDGLDHAHDIIKEYAYTKSTDPQKSSGVLFNLPIFVYTENFVPYWDYNAILPTPTGEFNPLTFDYYRYNLVITSAPNYTLSGYDGINIGYSEVKEHNFGNGYVISRYSTPGRALVDNDQINGDCDPLEDGYCDGLFTSAPVKYYSYKELCYDGLPDLNSNDPIDLTGLQFTSNGYPFAPKLNYDWNRGLLLSQKYFTEQNKVVKEVTNEYVKYTPGKKWPQYIYGLRRARMSNYRLYVSRCYSYIGPWRFHVAVRYPIITNIAKVLGKTTTKVYNLNSGSVLSESAYTYNGNQKQPSELTTTTSKNQIDKVRYSYPRDLVTPPVFDAGTTNPISFLVQHHNISNAIETVYSKIIDGIEEITGASITQYGNFGLPIVLPGNIRTLKITAPISKSTFHPATINWAGTSEVFNLDPAYQEDIAVSKYDSNSNPIQIISKSKQVTSFLWGYNKQYPIAQVLNASINNIFYEGFEDGNGNNSTSKTGNYCFIGNYTKVMTGLDNGTYRLTYWSYNGTSWVFNTLDNIVVAGTSYQININGELDDIRFFPTNAEMTTYTYNPLIGVTSLTDPKGRITYYEYDSFQRLKNIRDQDKNILKNYDYHYKN